MSFNPYRQDAPERLQSLINQSREDLDSPAMKWYVSQQSPTDDERVNAIDVVTRIEQIASEDPYLILIQAFDLPEQEKKLVLDTAGVLRLGELIAEEYIEP